MPALQTTFSEEIPGGFPGMEADGEGSNIISRTLEGSTDCEFGRPVFRGSADKGVTLTVSAALMGIAIATKGLPLIADRPADVYAPGDTVAIKERGKIWVTCSTAAADGAQVYSTSGGAISNSSGGGNTALAGWFFEDTISTGGIVRIVRR